MSAHNLILVDKAVIIAALLKSKWFGDNTGYRKTENQTTTQGYDTRLMIGTFQHPKYFTNIPRTNITIGIKPEYIPNL